MVDDMRRIIIIGMLLLIGFTPNRMDAQAPQWLERQTTYIAVLYPAGSEAEAERYAGFVDALYQETTAQLGYQPAPPLTLRIYPTMDVYRQVNPLAQNMEGIVAHAHTGRREISIAVPQTVGLSDEEIRNNVRHELTHIIAAELSGGQLSVMWQEGIAQYVERPTPQLEWKSRLLRQAVDARSVVSWRQLDAPGVMYSNPTLGYPQSWSIVSFLIQRAGMPKFVQFLEAMKTASGYSTALQEAYGESADTLETAWRAQLDAWIDDGWRVQTTPALDRTNIQQALDAGRYAEAQTAAEAALVGGNDPALATLRDLAAQGVEADAAFGAARVALLAGNYPIAASETERARSLFGSLSRPDVTPLLDEYAFRAREGQRAYALLQIARTDLRSLRLNAGQRNVEAAAIIFATLGDEQGRAAAQTLLDTLHTRVRLAGVGLLMLVVLGLAWNIDRRRAARRRAVPFG